MPTMPALPNTIDAGTPIVAEEYQQNYEAIRTQLNGLLDGDNFTDAARHLLSVYPGGLTRGKSIILGQQSTASTTYTKLTTPDQVTFLIMPDDGLLIVNWAFWMHSLNPPTHAAQFALFIDNNIAQTRGPNIGTTDIAFGTGATTPQSFQSRENGLDYQNFGAPVAPTTGAMFGGQQVFWVAAGIHDVSMRFKNVLAGNNAFVSNRRLYARTIAY